MKTPAINLYNLTWPGILTVCGQDGGAYRENVCYGAMFDYAYERLMSQGRKKDPDYEGDDDYVSEFYRNDWFDLGEDLAITSFVNRHDSVPEDLASWWIDELLGNLLPVEYLQEGLIHINSDFRWPDIDPDYALCASDILWDDDLDRDQIDETLHPILRLDVSQKLCGRLQLAVGALFRYMTECGGFIHLYHGLRKATRMTPDQCFVVSSVLCPTDGHGIGQFSQITSENLKELQEYSLADRFRMMQDADKPFWKDARKNGMIDSGLALKHTAVHGARWAWSNRGYHLYEGGKTVTHRNEDRGTPIGDKVFVTPTGDASTWLLKQLEKEGLL